MVSFIIVNYNGFEFTKSCLSSILMKAGDVSLYEVIIVDNSITSEDYKLLENYISERHLSNVKLLRVDNKGFGHANNRGVEIAEGEFIFLINNDAELMGEINWEEVQKLFSNLEIGLIAPKVLYPDKSIQPNCSTFVTPFASVLRFLKVGSFFYNSKILSALIRFFFGKKKVASSYFSREAMADQERFVDWASGCSLLLKREEFISVGMFDENFFMYYEDEELCYRFMKRNKKTYYWPYIVVSHYVGGSGGGGVNKRIEKEKINSELYYYRKHYPSASKKIRYIYILTSIICSPFNKRMRVIANSFSRKEI